MKRTIAYSIIYLFFFTSCMSISEITPTVIPTHETLNNPVESPTPTIDPTPNLVSLKGVVFFDLNGNTFQDSAIDYEGEEIQEKSLEGIPICIDFSPEGMSDLEILESEKCTITGIDGSYSFQHNNPGDHKLYVINPFEEPALAFRFINVLNNHVVIPEYTKEVDPATMQLLSAIIPCDDNNDDLVCKLGESTLLINEQHLGDTEIQLINDPISMQLVDNTEFNIALMQGILTLPFEKENVDITPFIFDYFDIIGNRVFNDDFSFFDSQDNVILSYDGRFNKIFFPTSYTPGVTVNPGVVDSHTGLDYFIPIGKYIISSAPTSEVWYLHDADGELRVDTWFDDINNPGYKIANDYGHLSVQLVDLEQTVYRGQILGLSGNTGLYSGYFPQLHFSIYKSTKEGWHYMDPYRYTIDFEDYPSDFWGSELSWWIQDNYPYFH